jgi:hypothetical protein
MLPLSRVTLTAEIIAGCSVVNVVVLAVELCSVRRLTHLSSTRTSNVLVWTPDLGTSSDYYRCGDNRKVMKRVIDSMLNCYLLA